uniref:Uncharacterized protein n=1 Tax=Euplotes crassus TaxID=5936 RepID=A0A7S3P0R7_EUPCR|mmetsp:Transcript_5247/g.5028  ORF Transcript_5247/g.5028 Transcript_5247/m.5028 type:complete len:173 (+) Transcript_5247:523-1041(+)
MSAAENALSSQERSSDRKIFNKYQSAFSPNRIHTAEKGVSRKDRVKKAWNKPNINKRGSKNRLEESKNVSKSNLNKTDINNVNNSYSDLRVQPVLKTMVDKKHRCPKHPGGCECKQDVVTDIRGRNKMEEYWTVNQFSIDARNKPAYRSSEKLDHENDRREKDNAAAQNSNL